MQGQINAVPLCSCFMLTQKASVTSAKKRRLGDITVAPVSAYNLEIESSAWSSRNEFANHRTPPHTTRRLSGVPYFGYYFPLRTLLKYASIVADSKTFVKWFVKKRTILWKTNKTKTEMLIKYCQNQKENMLHMKNIYSIEMYINSFMFTI